jgi:hypothetical protein
MGYGLSDVACETLAAPWAGFEKGGTILSGLSVAIVQFEAGVHGSKRCQSGMPNVPKRKQHGLLEVVLTEAGKAT